MDKIFIEDKLRYIGISISGGSGKKIPGGQWIDIERTIYEATLDVDNSTRTFFVLCSWVKVHGDYVITEKLMNLQKEKYSPWLAALAIFAAEEGYHKWKRLIVKQKNEKVLGNIKVAKQAIKFKGKDEAYIANGFLIAKEGIRARESDVLAPQALILKNTQYRNRYIYGANIRADIVCAIEMGVDNPYRIAKLVGCSYHPAHRIFNEYKLVGLLGPGNLLRL